MSSWNCPHNNKGKCEKVKQRECDPGMKGCVLFGRFTFSDPKKNKKSKEKIVSRLILLYNIHSTEDNIT